MLELRLGHVSHCDNLETGTPTGKMGKTVYVSSLWIEPGTGQRLLLSVILREWFRFNMLIMVVYPGVIKLGELNRKVFYILTGGTV